MNTRYDLLNSCYIKDLVDEWLYKFQLLPKEIRLEKTTNWEDVEIPGRSVPLKFYRSSNSENLTLNLSLVTSMFQGDDFEEQIYQSIRNLKSMPYPDYTDKYTRPPHKYLVMIGNTLNDIAYDDYRFIGVCKSVNVKYNLPYDLETKRSMFINADITFEEVRDEPYGLHDIRGI